MSGGSITGNTSAFENGGAADVVIGNGNAGDGVPAGKITLSGSAEIGKLILLSNIDENVPFTENILFLDESRKKYDMFNSDKIVSAQVRLVPDSSKFQSKKYVMYKSFAYAVAYLTGVSEDNSQFNLMIQKDNDVNHVHLTFKQWNQLHANDSGREL
jgi:hypothetical protein